MQASDSVHTAFDEVSLVTITPKAPQPLIERPLMGEVFGLGKVIAVQGQASDWQDGPLTGNALRWYLDGALVRSGESLQLADVAEGQHTLELRATNSAALTGTMSVSFWVGAGPHSYLPVIVR